MKWTKCLIILQLPLLWSTHATGGNLGDGLNQTVSTDCLEGAAAVVVGLIRASAPLGVQAAEEHVHQLIAACLSNQDADSLLQALHAHWEQEASGTGNTSIPDAGSDSHGPRASVIVPAVVVPGTLAIIAAAVLALVLARRWRARTGSTSRSGRKVEPPQHAGTTLVLTDIEGSTDLWDALDSSIMDTALQLHHATVRAVCLQHRGYESATEGDSFVLTFDSPHNAVLFSVDVQDALLLCDWPQQLLDASQAAPLYCQALGNGSSIVSGPAVNSVAQMSFGRGSLLSQSFAGLMSLGGSQHVRSSQVQSGCEHSPQGLRHASSNLGSTHSGLPCSPSTNTLRDGDRNRGQPRTPLQAPAASPGSRAGAVKPQQHRQLRHMHSAGEASLSGRAGGRSSPHARDIGTGIQHSSTPGGLGVAAGAVTPRKGYRRGWASLMRGRGRDHPGAYLPAPTPAELLGSSSLAVEATIEEGEAVESDNRTRLPAAIRMTSPLDGQPVYVSLSGRGDGRASGEGRLAEEHALHGEGEEELASPGPSIEMPVVVPISASSRQVSELGRVETELGASSDSSTGRHCTASGCFRAKTLGRHVLRSYPLADGLGPGRVVIFRGLRVRIGMHTGMEDSRNAVYNRTAGRMQYTGGFSAAARIVQNAAPGGLSLLCEHTKQALGGAFGAEHDVVVAHMGEHVIGGEDARRLVHLYAAFRPHQLPRLVYAQAIRSKPSPLSSLGVLGAPYGEAVIGYMHAVGLASLQTYDMGLAAHSLAVYRRTASLALNACGGYLVEESDGLLLVAFTRATPALTWALTTLRQCLEADWPPALLHHELGEEIMLHAHLRQSKSRAASHGHPGTAPADDLLLFRGLRIKAGLDVGMVAASVHPVLGRMSYRGRVMNRAARISGAAKTGQVWSSALLWAKHQHESARCTSPAPAAMGSPSSHAAALVALPGAVLGAESGAGASVTPEFIAATPMGSFKLKGVSTRQELLHCYYAHEDPQASHTKPGSHRSSATPSSRPSKVMAAVSAMLDADRKPGQRKSVSYLLPQPDPDTV